MEFPTEEGKILHLAQTMSGGLKANQDIYNEYLTERDAAVAAQAAAEQATVAKQGALQSMAAYEVLCRDRTPGAGGNGEWDNEGVSISTQVTLTNQPRGKELEYGVVALNRVSVRLRGIKRG